MVKVKIAQYQDSDYNVQLCAGGGSYEANNPIHADVVTWFKRRRMDQNKIIYYGEFIHVVFDNKVAADKLIASLASKDRVIELHTPGQHYQPY